MRRFPDVAEGRARQGGKGEEERGRRRRGGKRVRRSRGGRGMRGWGGVKQWRSFHSSGQGQARSLESCVSVGQETRVVP